LVRLETAVSGPWNLPLLVVGESTFMITVWTTVFENTVSDF
jgi:hypothetical protein